MKNHVPHLLCTFLIAVTTLSLFANTADRNCSVSVTATATDASAPQAHDGHVTTTVSNGTAPFVYSWYTGETTSALTNLGTGTYYVTVTDANNCTASASASVSAPGCQGFGVSISFYGASNPNENSAAVTTINGTAPFTYLWSTGATTDSIAHLPDGHYCVTVTDANNCTVRPCAGNTLVSGIEEATGAGKITVYPNPVNNMLTIELAEQENAVLTIATLEGRVLLTQSLTTGKNTIATATLPAGLYVYSIAANATQGRVRSKLLIIH